MEPFQPLSMDGVARVHEQQCLVCLRPHFPFCIPGHSFQAPASAGGTFGGKTNASADRTNFHQAHPSTHYGTSFPNRSDQYLHQATHLSKSHYDFTNPVQHRLDHNLAPMGMTGNNPPDHVIGSHPFEGRYHREQASIQQQRKMNAMGGVLHLSGPGDAILKSGPASNPMFTDVTSRHIVDHGLQRTGHRSSIREVDEAARVTYGYAQTYDGRVEQLTTRRGSFEEGRGYMFDQRINNFKDSSSQDNNWVGDSFSQVHSSYPVNFSYGGTKNWSGQVDMTSGMHLRSVSSEIYAFHHRNYFLGDKKTQESEADTLLSLNRPNAVNEPSFHPKKYSREEGCMMRQGLQMFELNKHRTEYLKSKDLDWSGHIQVEDLHEVDFKRKHSSVNCLSHKPMSREVELLIEQGLVDESSGPESPSCHSLVRKKDFVSEDPVVPETHSLQKPLKNFDQNTNAARDLQSQIDHNNCVIERCLTGGLSHYGELHQSQDNSSQQSGDKREIVLSDNPLYYGGQNTSYYGQREQPPPVPSGSLGHYYGDEGMHQQKVQRQYQEWEAEQQHGRALKRAKEMVWEIQQRDENMGSLKSSLVQDAHFQEHCPFSFSQMKEESRMEQKASVWYSPCSQVSKHDLDLQYRSYSHERYEATVAQSIFQHDKELANRIHRAAVVFSQCDMSSSLELYNRNNNLEKFGLSEWHHNDRSKPIQKCQQATQVSHPRFEVELQDMEQELITESQSGKCRDLTQGQQTQDFQDPNACHTRKAQYNDSLDPAMLNLDQPDAPALPPDAPPPLPPPPTSMTSGSIPSSEVQLTQVLPLQCVDSRSKESVQRVVQFMPCALSNYNSQTSSGLPQFQDKSKVVDAANIFRNPGRLTRPDLFVVILRGLPGSGKSYLAKSLRDVEVMNGGNAPHIHSMDNYFMSEVEKIEDDTTSLSGLKSKKKIVKRVMQYCYEPEMEEAYRASMLKAFRKTLDEGMFNFIIVDDRNVLVADFSQFWATAKRSGYEVYVLEAPYKDVKGCVARNVHNFTLEQIQSMADRWEATPSLYLNLDVSSLFRGDDLNAQDIIEVEMDADDMERDLEEEEEASLASGSSSTTCFRPKGKPILGDKWDANMEHKAAAANEKSLADVASNIEQVYHNKSSALSGLMMTYGKKAKFVHWSDNQTGGRVKGFAIGRKSTPLVIGPGPGYNMTSNPLIEEFEQEVRPASRQNLKFVEQLRAEQESFKAAFAHRRQRIGGMEDDDDD